MKARQASLLLSLAIAFPLQGCYSWQAPPRVSPRVYVEHERPEWVRLDVGATPVTVEFAAPTIRTDSIFGAGAGPGVPLAEVRSLKVNRLDPGRTALLSAAVVGSFFLIKGLIEGIETGKNNYYSGSSSGSGPFGCWFSC